MTIYLVGFSGIHMQKCKELCGREYDYSKSFYLKIAVSLIFNLRTGNNTTALQLANMTRQNMYVVYMLSKPSWKL